MGCIAGAAVAAVAAGGAAAMQAESSRKAASQQREAVRDANALEYQRFQEARGSTGSAVLPIYAKELEAKAYQNAFDAFEANSAVPAAKLKTQYQGIVDAQMPSVAAGNEVIAGIFNGDITQDRLDALAPVIAARTDMSLAQKAQILQAMQEEKNRIAAADARKGYSGGGSVSNNAMLQATIGARQQAAMAEAIANLQNEEAKRAVVDAGTDLKIKSIDLPVQRANQLIALQQSPSVAVAKQAETAMAPLAFFNIGPGTPPSVRVEQYPDLPSTGAVALGAVSQAAGAYGNYKAYNNAASGFAGSRVGAAGYQTPDNWGSLTPAQQSAYASAIQGNAGAGGAWE